MNNHANEPIPEHRLTDIKTVAGTGPTRERVKRLFETKPWLRESERSSRTSVDHLEERPRSELMSGIVPHYRP